MISNLKGTLESLSANVLIVNIGAMSLEIHAPTSTISTVGGVGQQIRLHTFLLIKEEMIALYGFSTSEERDLFVLLNGVGGIGPKLALALLSAMKPQSLATAIASGDTSTLIQVPGMGKKTAGRLILELKGKMEQQWGQSAITVSHDNAELMAALSALGFSNSEVGEALNDISLESLSTLEEKVRIVLQRLNARLG